MSKAQKTLLSTYNLYDNLENEKGLRPFLRIFSLSPLFSSVLNIKSTAEWTKICEGTKGRTKSSQHLSIHFILQWIHVTTFLGYSAVHVSWKVESLCIFKKAKGHTDLSWCVCFSDSCRVNLCPISHPYNCKIKFHIFSLKIHGAFCNYLHLKEFQAAGSLDPTYLPRSSILF